MKAEQTGTRTGRKAATARRSVGTPTSATAGAPHRWACRTTALPVVAALAAIAWLVVAPPSKPASSTDRSGTLSVTEAWPKTRYGPEASGKLADGSQFLPSRYLTDSISVGVATTTAGRQVTLRGPGDTVRPLHMLASDGTGRADGFAVDGDVLAWTERHYGPKPPATQVDIWAVNWRDPAAVARKVVTNAGFPIVRTFQDDLVVAQGRVHWLSSATPYAKTIELRSAPLSGGAVSVRPVPGGTRLSTWPWLSTVDPLPGLPTVLLNLETNTKVQVAVQGGESANCSPAWCRVTVPGAAGPRTEVMRPDGSQRRLLQNGTIRSSVPEIGLADRFEIYLGLSDRTKGAVALNVFDNATGTRAVIAENPTFIDAADNVVWWSTGGGDETIWHALDLTTLQ